MGSGIDVEEQHGVSDHRLTFRRASLHKLSEAKIHLPVSEIPVLVFLTETLQEIPVASSVCDFAFKRAGGAALSCMVWFFLRGMVLVTSGHCHVKRSLQCLV